MPVFHHQSSGPQSNLLSSSCGVSPSKRLFRCGSLRILLITVIAVVFQQLSGSASAQTLWVADGIGNWYVPANWSTGIPASGASPQINNGGTARLFDGGVFTHNVTLGYNPGNIGTLEVLGGRADFRGISVGYEGRGTLKIAGSGSLTISHGFISFIGDLKDSVGTATVDGAGSEWINSSDLGVGANGDGALHITGGGAVTAVTGYIGAGRSSTSLATVDGVGSTWTNSGDLSVGHTGIGTLSITAGGRVSNNNANIAADLGSGGAATVNGAGSVWINSSVLTVGGEGEGALNITGGGLVTSTNARIGRSAYSIGTVLIDGPGSRWNASGEFSMGLFSTGTSTLTVQNGGVLSAAGGMLVHGLGTIRGNGTISSNVTSFGGTIAPGALAAGALHVTGNYSQTHGRVQIDLASNTSFDKLAVTGNLSFGGLGGGALEVSLAGGYVPHGSQSFDILDWGTVSGSFDSISLPTLGGTLIWNTSQLYTTGVLSVTGPAAPILAADFDENGVVNSADLTRWRTGFGTGTTHLQGNADGDGDVDGADFLVWQRQLGSPSNIAATTSVPEPASLGLLLASACVLVAVKRRTKQESHNLRKRHDSIG